MGKNTHTAERPAACDLIRGNKSTASLAGIAGLNPAGGMNVCVLCIVQQGQKAKPGKAGQRSTDEVQRKKNKFRQEHLMSVCCKC
jgi:hypothetical protein